MELVYTGPHDAVEVDLPLDQTPTERVLVGRGESHDFPSGVANRLLEQPTNWQRASSKHKTTAKGGGVEADAKASLDAEVSPAAEPTSPTDGGKKE